MAVIPGITRDVDEFLDEMFADDLNFDAYGDGLTKDSVETTRDALADKRITWEQWGISPETYAAKFNKRAARLFASLFGVTKRTTHGMTFVKRTPLLEQTIAQHVAGMVANNRCNASAAKVYAALAFACTSKENYKATFVSDSLGPMSGCSHDTITESIKALNKCGLAIRTSGGKGRKPARYQLYSLAFLDIAEQVAWELADYVYMVDKLRWGAAQLSEWQRNGDLRLFPK